MEKRTPHYALDSIKATFAAEASLRMTKTAQDAALALGLLLADDREDHPGHDARAILQVDDLVRGPSHRQDVYHVPVESTVLYVKFTTDAQGYLVISFKEK